VTLELVDIGANLADAAFRSDLDAVVDRALAAGVVQIVLTGTSVAESGRALALARTRPGVLFATAGVHPHYSRDCDEATLAALRALHREPGVVAVGECGLDFFRDLSPRPVQERWFEAQVALAAQLGRPLFVHDRQAGGRVHAILRAHRSSFPRAVVHCFTGGEAALRSYLDLGLHVGITGWICDERRGQELQRLVRLVLRDRLLLETDAPYLLPRTMRPRPPSRRNEPAYLPFVLDAVAACVGLPHEQVAASTTANARAFFGLPEPAHGKVPAGRP
jgi:TatD DNase family protein